MSASHAPVLIAGAGAWGTALAGLIAANGREARLWGHREAHVAALARARRNERHLPRYAFPEGLRPVPALGPALEEVEDVLVAVPLGGLRATLQHLSEAGSGGLRITWACKGIEVGTGRMCHEIVEAVLGRRPHAVISGPTFAAEVADGLPSAAVVAANDDRLASDLVDMLHSRSFRLYTSRDVIGVEIAGAVKNVLAIAAGVSDGLGLGANARAALITRGLAEMARLGVAADGRPETFMGLAGVGDLILTCGDDQSRNRRLGLALARGRTAAEAADGVTVEGVSTAPEVERLAGRMGVDMPICRQVTRVLHGVCTPAQALDALLERAPKAE